MMKCIVCVCAFFLSLSAWAQAKVQTISYSTQQLKLQLPPGFCPLGASAMERSIWTYQATNAATSGELVQLGFPCEQLEAYRAGNVEALTRWVQVLLLKPHGKQVLVQGSRSAFVKTLAGTAKAMPSTSVDESLREHLAKTKTEVKMSSLEQLGYDADALYVIGRGDGKVEGDAFQFAAVGAFSVANKIPFLLSAYETPGTKGPDPAQTMRVYLNMTLAANP